MSQENPRAARKILKNPSVIRTVGSVEVRRIILKRAVRFGMTGAFVTGVHFVVAVFFVQYVVQNPPIANGVAFIFATVTSYLINTVWSFSSKLHGQTLFRFGAVSSIGFVLAISVAWAVETLGFGYLTGIFAVAITVPPTTFFLHNFWTYR